MKIITQETVRLAAIRLQQDFDATLAFCESDGDSLAMLGDTGTDAHVFECCLSALARALNTVIAEQG